MRFTTFRLLLPKETETATNKISGSEHDDDVPATTEPTEVEVSTVVNSDNLAESLDQQQEQQQQQQNNNITNTVSSGDLPKFDQYILDSITAAASSSSTSITSSMGFQNFCTNGASISSQNTNDTHEMPQLLNILNELLDGQDLSSLANSGGMPDNGDNMQDMVDQEENYEDDSPRKDDPEEMARILAQQRLEEISKEEQQLRRRMDFMIRRLYKLVSRSTGLHVSEEIAGFLEHVARYSKKKDVKEKSLVTATTPTTKFSYLTTLQGTSTDLLMAPEFPSEPPLNLLSSPTNSQEQKNDDINPSLSPQQNIIKNNNNNNKTTTSTPTFHNTINNNNTNDKIATTDVIEPTTIIIATDTLKPVSMKEMKSFLRRVDNISTMQSTVMTKKALAFKYFSKSSSLTTSTTIPSSNLNQLSKVESNFNVSAIPKLEDAVVDQIDETSGLLMSEMRLIENQIDSDATASSTGGESADEMTVYNNNYQYPLSM